MSQANQGVWSPEVMMGFRGISGVRVSPDGRWATFVVREAVMDAARSEYANRIHVARRDGGEEYPLTSGEESAYGPRWSPDGRRIAYVSGRSGKDNLWLSPAGGGEARQLTDVETEVDSYKWSPDGEKIAFTAMDPPTPEEKKAREERNDPIVVDAHVKMRRLHVIPFGPNPDGPQKSRVLTPGNLSVGLPEFPGVYEWAPDGKTIAFTHTITPRSNDWVTARISVIDVESAEIRPLVEADGPALEPWYSPDGRWIACKVYEAPGWIPHATVCVVPATGGDLRALAPTPDHRPDVFGWSADGTRLFFTECHGTGYGLYSLPLDGPPELIAREDGLITLPELAPSRVAMGYVLETPDRPPEAQVRRLDGSEPVQVSHANEHLPRELPGEVEVIRWRSPDGTEIEGLLMRPAGPARDGRYPLLVSAHGGPTGVWSLGFLGIPSFHGPVAAFLERGFAVLRPNVRGSTGYGRAFRQACYRDWGGQDLEDLLAGVDHCIDLGVADPDRLGVLGWSYGGYLAAAAITRTRRFRAAMVGAGITNLISNAGTADIPGDIPGCFGGEPWQEFELLRERSPALNVGDVDTPTLILHGALDRRVPTTQGWELYNALKRRGCPVQMVIYPRTPHVPLEPKLNLDVMKRTLAWFENYLLADRE